MSSMRHVATSVSLPLLFVAQSLIGVLGLQPVVNVPHVLAAR